MASLERRALAVFPASGNQNAIGRKARAISLHRCAAAQQRFCKGQGQAQGLGRAGHIHRHANAVLCIPAAIDDNGVLTGMRGIVHVSPGQHGQPMTQGGQIPD